MKLTQSIPWWDRAISNSEMISNAFEVFKAWLARIADWVLFFCLIANIIEIFPLPAWFAVIFGNIVMGIQVVSLDVAGFGLAAMGASARRRGDTRSANKASYMGWALISVMIVTVVLVTVGVVFPKTQGNIDTVQKVLILVRIGITVLYGHIVHSLRVDRVAHENRVKEVENVLATTQRELAAKSQEVSGVQQKLSNQTVQLDTLRQEIGQLTGRLNIKEQELSNLQSLLSTGQDFKAARVSSLEQELEREQATQAGLRRELFAVKAELDRVQLALSNEQQLVSNLRRELSSGQQKTSNQRVQPRTKKVSSGLSNVVQLDSARKQIGQEGTPEMRIRTLHKKTPIHDMPARTIAEEVGCSPQTALTWKEKIISEEKRLVNE